MNEISYKILYKGGMGEIVEKKSRFIANVRKTETEEEAQIFISEMKKKYWDASHNCYAFVSGRNHQLMRSSDDGEPSSTAGRPILDVLLREDIHDAAIVVTRYFGGTLLGTGGLVRAYQKAAQEGLRNSIIVEKRQGIIVHIRTDYSGIGKIQFLLGKQKNTIIDSQYGEQVEIQAVVPVENLEKTIREILEGTGGKALMEQGKSIEFAQIDKEIKILTM